MNDYRRRESRIEVLGKVECRIDALEGPVVVHEMSLHGLGIVTSSALRPGAVHDFRLTLGDGAFVMVSGRVAHCRAVVALGADTRYVSGIQFLEDEAPALSVAS